MSRREAGARAGRLRTHLVRGTVGSFGVVGASRLLQLASAVILARLLPASGYGIYATSLAVVTLLGVPTMFGLPTMLVRFVAAYELREDWARLRGVLGWASRAGFGVALTLAVAAAIVVRLAGPRLGDGMEAALLISLALLPVLTMIAIPASALRGLRHVVLGQVPMSLLLPGAFVAFLLVWATAVQHDVHVTAAVAVGARVACAVVAMAAGAALLASRLPAAVRSAVAEVDHAEWLRAAFPLLLFGGLQVINTRTDILMLALLKGATATGIYQAASRGADLAVFGLMVVNVAIQPTVARLHAAGDTVRLQRLVTSAARAATAVALPTAVAFVAAGGPILRAVFGAEYGQGAGVLAVLAAAQVVNAGMGSVGLILNMTGHERLAAQGMSAGAAANVLLNLALIPLWGTTGAAIATALSLILWNVVQGVHVRRRLGLRPSVLGALRTGG